MKKLLIPLLGLVAASAGCIVVDDDHPRHRHCVGCGHVYVKGTWR